MELLATIKTPLYSDYMKATKTKKPKEDKNPVGHPEKKSPEVMMKIEKAAAFGASIGEIAFYAGIHRGTLHRWMQEDEILRDRIAALQENPILLARQSVVKQMEKDGDLALKFLERKRKAEFSTRAEQVEMTPTEALKLDEKESEEVTNALTLIGLGSILKKNGNSKTKK